MANQNESVVWQLAGIAQEKQALASRLDYLNQQERSLRGRAPGRTKLGTEGVVQTRKRVISDEQRQKMREAQQARWAKIKGEQAQQAEPEAKKPARDRRRAAPQVTAETPAEAVTA